MDMATVTFVAGIISCIIGVSTFVNGRMTKAEQNGSMETKINQALEGITSINKKLEDSQHSQHSIELMVRSHDEQLKTLFRSNQDLQKMIDESNKTREILVELLQVIKHMNEKG